MALLGAAFVLTYSVIVRYFLKFSTDWQDEMSVFLIIGAVFMSAAAIQAGRGHVAIEAIVENFHSGSTWGPPLWIPYSLMTVGMTLLGMQLLIQIVNELRRGRLPA